MQQCPNCGHQNRPGIVFCENCGASLIGRLPLDTKSLDSEEDKSQFGVDASILTDVKVQGLSTFEEGATLRLEIEGSPDPILFKPKTETIFGRRDPATGAMPDVDLTPFAGYRMGVSRRHAAIRFGEDKTLDLWDLGSSNGTFLNGQRLSAHRPYRLHDGDEIRLGQMVIKVSFQPPEKSPAVLTPPTAQPAVEPPPSTTVLDSDLPPAGAPVTAEQPPLDVAKPPEVKPPQAPPAPFVPEAAKPKPPGTAPLTENEVVKPEDASVVPAPQPSVPAPTDSVPQVPAVPPAVPPSAPEKPAEPPKEAAPSKPEDAPAAKPVLPPLSAPLSVAPEKPAAVTPKAPENGGSEKSQPQDEQKRD